MAATIFQAQQKLFEPSYAPSQVLAPKKASSDKITPKMWGLMGIVLVGLVGSYIHTVLLESKANQKQQEIIAIKEKNDKLQATLAELKTLPAIEIKAQSMGMQQVKSFSYLKVAPAVFAASAAMPEAQTPAEPIRQLPVGF